MAGQVQCDDSKVPREVTELVPPVAAVAGPAVNKNQGRRACAADLIGQGDAVGRRGNSVQPNNLAPGLVGLLALLR